MDVDRYEALLERGRGMQAHAAIDPRRTALLVVDLQNGFMLPDSAFGMSSALKLVPLANRMAAAFRDAGAHVVWTRHTYGDDAGRALAPWQRAQPVNQALAATFRVGTQAHALHPDLDVRDEDSQLDKYRYSAFSPHSSDLAALLDGKGINTVVVIGCAANCCCDGTARDAYALGYRVFFPSDANAAFTRDEAEGAIVNLGMTCADTRPSDIVLALLAPVTA